MADEKVERVSANPGGVDEHRPLTTGDLEMIAAYVKDRNKSSSSSSSKSSSKSKSSSGRKSSSRSAGSSRRGGRS